MEYGSFFSTDRSTVHCCAYLLYFIRILLVSIVFLGSVILLLIFGGLLSVLLLSIATYGIPSNLLFDVCCNWFLYSYCYYYLYYLY